MKERTDSKTPRIRFKGHFETWRTESVSSLLTERNVQAPKSELYPLMAFIAGQGVAPKGKRYNREFLVSDELNKKYKQTELGDFIYSSNNLETGSIGTNNYGSASISPVYSIFSPTLEGNSSFIGQLLCKKAFINEMVKWRQGVVYGQWRIHESDFLKIKATFPTVHEQTQIGGYFRELDRLIGLHQRKHDKLVTLKKAMLQKMFPQPGATTPEIRFKGFSGEWEEEKLGKLGAFSKGQGYSKSDLTTSGTPIVLYGRLYVNYQTTISGVDTFVVEKKGAVKSVGREVIVPASGETAEDIARASAILTEGIILGGDLNIIYPFNELDSCFLALTLSNGKPQTDLAKRAQGKTVVHVRKADIESILIPFPKLAEQQKIGSYFRTLDELISQHATQLQKLQQIKSACLEKMFV